MSKFLALAVVALLAVSAQAQSVELRKTDGSTVSGELKGLYQEGIRLTNRGAVVDVPWARIMTLTSDDDVHMNFGDDERIKVRLSGVQDGQLMVVSPLLGAMKIESSSLPIAPAIEPVAAAEAKKGPLDPKDWNGHVSFNVGLTAGNSDTLLASLEALVETQTSHDRYEIQLNAVYGESDGVENANAQGLKGAWRHYYHEHLYSYLRPHLMRDKIQSIDFAAFLDVGAGWVVWRDSDDETLALEGGLGYRHESYSDATEARNDITGRAAVVYEDIFFDKVDFKFTAELIVPLNEPNAWLGRSELNWSIPVSESWAFDNVVRVSYRNEPAGTAEEFDLFVGAGLKYSF